jgi:thiol-disulfide isomerase/thioredoxin
MKYCLNLFITLCLCVNLSAQGNTVQLAGKINPEKKLTEINIRNIDGIVATVPVKEDGSFTISTDKLSQGFYDAEELGHLYFKPGFNLSVTPQPNGYYRFSGTGAIENNALSQAREALKNYIPLDEKKQPAQEVYYMDVPEFLEKLNAFFDNGRKLFSQSKDAFFNEYANADLRYVGREACWIYSIYYGKDLKKMDAFYAFVEKADRDAPNYAEQLDSAYKAAEVKSLDSISRNTLYAFLYEDWDKNNETLFIHSSSYRRAIANFIARTSNTPKYRLNMLTYDRLLHHANQLRVVRGEITSPYIREYYEYTYTDDLLKMSRDSATLEQYYREYLANSQSEKNRRRLEQVYLNAKTYTDKAAAPSFAYKDISGKTVSLQDLRGKYVYIDVWATWCTPCKAEIPHLKKVEADYHGKNIAFVSISVDQPKDQAKWEQYVKENNLSGIQLVADKAFDSEFIQKMNINAIPRFILIDPQGNIVAADALRPSNKELRTLLDQLL